MTATAAIDPSEVVVTVSLITLPAVAFLLLTILAICFWHQGRAGRRRAKQRQTHNPSRSIRSHLFEQPGRWLAVRSSSVADVRSALCLDQATPCSWDDGLTEARERMLFVAPPVDGWVLVVGHSLPDPTEDPDRAFHFLRRLSNRIGHVQFFSVNRIVNYHAWVIVDQGEIFRAYAWAGEVAWNQGPITAAERELKMRIRPYASESERPMSSDEAGANCDRLIRLASRWGIDPAMVAEEVASGDGGIVGRISRRI